MSSRAQLDELVATPGWARRSTPVGTASWTLVRQGRRCLPSRSDGEDCRHAAQPRSGCARCNKAKSTGDTAVRFLYRGTCPEGGGERLSLERPLVARARSARSSSCTTSPRWKVGTRRAGRRGADPLAQHRAWGWWRLGEFIPLLEETGLIVRGGRLGDCAGPPRPLALEQDGPRARRVSR